MDVMFLSVVSVEIYQSSHPLVIEARFKIWKSSPGLAALPERDIDPFEVMPDRARTKRNHVVSLPRLMRGVLVSVAIMSRSGAVFLGILDCRAAQVAIYENCLSARQLDTFLDCCGQS